MKRKIVGIFVCTLFIISAFAGLSYGKNTSLSIETEKLNDPVYTIMFNQIDFEIDGTFILDSAWGEAVIAYELGTTFDTYYLNLAVEERWVFQNIPIGMSGTSDTLTLDFDLAVENGIDVTLLYYACEITPEPLEIPPMDYVPIDVLDRGGIIYSGEIDHHITFTIPGPLIGFLPVDGAWHNKSDIYNQECGVAECVPAAISNSLKFLKKKHNLDMPDANISIAKMKPATGWTANGAPAGANPWWERKKKYMEDNDYPIVTTIHDDDVNLTNIIKEIRKGQDVELRVPGHAAMVTGITKLANGKYIFKITHDTKQGEAGGTENQLSSYDPTTKTFTGGKWIDGKKLSKIVVECPKENNPPVKPEIEGTTKGVRGASYPYLFTSIDPDGDDVSYYIDWGDGTTSGWTPTQASGTTYTESHTWNIENTYTIKAKAMDTHGAQSDWSELDVTMPRNRAINTPFLRFLEQYPILYQLLQRFLRL